MNKMPSRRQLITTIAAGSLMLGIGFLGAHYGSPTTDSSEAILLEMVDKCDHLESEKMEGCFAGKILAQVEKDPAKTGSIFESLWRLAVDGKIKGDPRVFSDLAHEAGMILAEKDLTLEQAFEGCGTSFKQGCMHGAVMESIDDMGDGQFSWEGWKKRCEALGKEAWRINCIHGIGHELAAKVKGGLSSVLGLCEMFPNNLRGKMACESGVLMEFTKGEAGVGRHSHEPVGSKPLPCDQLPEKYRGVCFAAEGSYRQYSPGKETFQQTYRFCASAPSKYRFGCLLGVSERAIIATAENAAKAYALCETLPVEERGACLESLIHVSKTEFGDPVLTRALESLRDQG